MSEPQKQPIAILKAYKVNYTVTTPTYVKGERFFTARVTCLMNPELAVQLAGAGFYYEYHQTFDLVYVGNKIESETFDKNSSSNVVNQMNQTQQNYNNNNNNSYPVIMEKKRNLDGPYLTVFLTLLLCAAFYLLSLYFTK